LRARFFLRLDALLGVEHLGAESGDTLVALAALFVGERYGQGANDAFHGQSFSVVMSPARAR
jgi:hypothetical protein